MTSASFQIGDAVQYRATGPIMHVITVVTQLCYCNWVDSSGVLHGGTFEQRHLTHADLPATGASPLDV